MGLWQINSYFKQYFATTLLLVFYLSEAYSKYGIFYTGGKSDIPRAIKLVVLLFLILGIIKPLKNLFYPLLLFSFFCIGQFFLHDGFNQEIVVSFTKFLFPVFLFTYFNKYPMGKTSKDILFRTFEYLLILNGILVILGFIFEISLFNSYRFGRWGFNGLFINTSTSSYIYSIAIFYFLLTLRKSFLKNWKSLFVIICALLTGTKLIYIAILVSVLLYLFFYTNLNQKIRNGVIILFIFTSLLLGYIFFFRWGIFNEIRQEHGLLSSVLSYRDDLFLKETLPYIQQNWGWPNYLFGGISEFDKRSQMGLIDLFYFWGVVGGITYILIFFRAFIPELVKKIGVYILLTLSLMVILAGNFFENASVAIYLLILKETLNENSRKSLPKPITNEKNKPLKN